MKKFLPVALLAVAVMAAPAAASVQNVKVSGDITSTGLVRKNFNLTKTDKYRQHLLLTQTRLRVDADLTDNVSTTVGLLNERVWGENNARVNSVSGSDENYGDNDININLAYVTLREMLYSPLTVIVGRQHFAYGNSFVIDSSGPNNSTSTGGLKGVAEDLSMQANLDAVRLVFDYNPLTIDVVGAKVNHKNNLGLGNKHDDVDLVGTNANWQIGDSLGTVLEGYFWAKVDHNNDQTAAANKKIDTVYMPGLRAEANLLDGWNVSAEAAMQKGHIYNSTSDLNLKRSAFAGQLISKYKLPLEETKKYSPLLTAGYTYLSGGHSLDNTDKYRAWDPMFENQGGGKIYNTLFDLSNVHVMTIKGDIKPLEDLTASLGWDSLWLAKAMSDNPDGTGITSITLKQPDGSTASATGTTKKHLGNEISMGLTYDYTEDVKLGATYGWFLPGNAFNKDGRVAATQAMVSASVAF